MQAVASQVQHQQQSGYLDLPALAALQHMRFATRRQIEGSFSGRHRSRQQGGASEFVDYRQYVPGEDLRRLDWKVLSRTGRPYIRLFQEETNLLCTLVLDASGSMRFGQGKADKRKGDGSKLDYAKFLATALSHVIGGQQDQIGIATVADGVQDFVAPGGTLSHVRRIQDIIERLDTRPVTNLGDGLRDLFTRLTRRGVLLILSDFLVDDLEKTFASVRLFRHRGWEVVILHLVHPQEERLPEGLAYRFEGLENDGRIDCSPAEIRAMYEHRFAAHAATVRSLTLSHGCDYRRVSTATHYLETLGSFLVERAG